MSPITYAPAAADPVDYAFHTAAGIFDLLEGAAFDELAADIKAHGLKLPIVLHDGLILDGRNRYRACKAAGVDPMFRQWDGAGSPSEFVWSLNNTRRHLDGNARALAAGRYQVQLEAEGKARRSANLKHSASKVPNGTIDSAGRSRAQAAEKFNLPERTVDRAAKVVKDGTPELQKAVADDRISISAAAAVADEDPDTQREIASHPEIKKAVRALNAAKALKAEADAMPPQPDRSPEEVANIQRSVGTQQDRARLMDILAAVKTVEGLPDPAAMADAVPSGLAHSVNPVALLKVADWFEKFARAWEAKQR